MRAKNNDLATHDSTQSLLLDSFMKGNLTIDRDLVVYRRVKCQWMIYFLCEALSDSALLVEINRA